MHFHLPKPLHGWREFAGEVGIIVLGVLIALGAEQLVETIHSNAQRRALVNETRSAVQDESELNLSRLARKLMLMHNAAEVLAKDPGRAADLVDARMNEEPQPLQAAWALATQGDVLRVLPADESRRISSAYTTQAIYISVMHEEMNAWTRLSRFGGPTDSVSEERDQAIREWRAYAQRVALAGCIEILRIERVLDARVPLHAADFCRKYRIEQDPSVIFRALNRPLPSLQTL